ncbi:glycosyltransferase family protein [Falsibacillus albus]|uniref:Glycosyltransferase n=1 Tax=Falsibacillus albus TaxID=2478915 RepID=A0A3L7K295_9BACI|nr:hypothetical protein [Falsibacillus albus]RLQ94812.1 hypothetical protein D9X91_12525 [Falsibacillus albus]
MKKIALIGDSSMLYMPYVSNYEKVLVDNNADYSIINWDRFQMENFDKENKYRDQKIGHRRNFIDYYKYSRFVIKKLSKTKYDKVIVFGIPLSFFLKGFLLKNYKRRYIIDIRDYHKILKVFNTSKLIENSLFTVISSPKYKEWLPKNDRYEINYNTKIKNKESLKPAIVNYKKNTFNISYIGATRDYDINTEFIKNLKNKEKYNIYFHGEGDINKDIKNYLITNNIKNVKLTGRYYREDEDKLYHTSDLINVLRYNDGINNKTALPNRLYNTVLHGKPMLAFKGTFLAEIINDYNLGLVVESFDEIDKDIENYFKGFNIDEYNLGRCNLIQDIIRENHKFIRNLEEFIYI